MGWIMEYSRQCILIKYLNHLNGDYVTTVSWIPEEYAITGNYIKLKDESGVWEDGWRVAKVMSRKETKEVNIRSRDYINQRQASDI